jgi:hypothetical protein
MTTERGQRSSHALILLAVLVLFYYQPLWILYIYVPAVVLVLGLLFCVSCRDPGLMERVTVSVGHDSATVDRMAWVSTG